MMSTPATKQQTVHHRHPIRTTSRFRRLYTREGQTRKLGIGIRLVTTLSGVWVMRLLRPVHRPVHEGPLLVDS